MWHCMLGLGSVEQCRVFYFVFWLSVQSEQFSRQRVLQQHKQNQHINRPVTASSKHELRSVTVAPHTSAPAGLTERESWTLLRLSIIPMKAPTHNVQTSVVHQPAETYVGHFTKVPLMIWSSSSDGPASHSLPLLGWLTECSAHVCNYGLRTTFY